jgi:adenylate cyclase
VNLLNTIAKAFHTTDPKRSITYGQQSSVLAAKLNFIRGLALAYKVTGIGYAYTGENVEAVKSYQLALQAYDSLGDKKGIANIYSNLGNVYYNQDEDVEALDLYLKALRYADESDDTLRMVTALVNVGAIYGKKPRDYDKAIEYYRKAFPLAKAIGDNSTFGIAAVDIGEIYMEKSVFDSAAYYYNISLNAVKGTEDAPYTMYDMGQLFMKQKKYDRAIEIFTQSVALAKNLDLKSDLAKALIGLGNAYKAKSDLVRAEENLLEAEKIAVETDAKYSLKDIYEALAAIHDAKKEYAKTAKYQSLLLAVKDSIYNLEADKKLNTLSFNYRLDKMKSEQEKKDAIALAELHRNKQQKYFLTGGLVMAIVFGYWDFRQKKRISQARKRSDELLLNILPGEVAEELKEKGSADAKQFDEVTVMFTDFKGFTRISEKLSPAELVNEIHGCFKAFDNIIGKHNIEKIKTIGDSYMCAGGLPVANKTHADDVVRAALEIQQFMQRHCEERKNSGKEIFEIRIGVHTGPVVAGIVGVKKFAYDIWGDTVNIASRMESSGEAGKVNISGATYELIKDKFTCKHRGKISAKNKGEIDMYFVERSCSGV